MFFDFDKESLFFINDSCFNANTKEDENYHMNLPALSNFLSRFHFLTYYIDPSLCNNVVILDEDYKKHNILEDLFPKINFFFEYDDLISLNQEGKTFSIIMDNGKDDMKYQEKIIEKFQPYSALIDFYFNQKRYLEGTLLRELFSTREKCKLIVRGFAYRDWKLSNIENQWFYFQNIEKNRNYINPFSNDNRTIYMERGFFNSFDETAMTIVVIDYLKKININVTYNNLINLLIHILDNLVAGKKINLNLEILIN